MANEWDKWVPGVLSGRQIEVLANASHLKGFKTTPRGSAVDLHIGDEAFVLKKGCVKPFGPGFRAALWNEELIENFPQDNDGRWVLEPKKTYLFALQERLFGLLDSPIWGQATAKSSVGRLDVLARLIVDGMHRYEGFRPDRLPQGDASMFLEVTPNTFPVCIKPGISLSQLRLFYGRPEECELLGEEISRTCLRASDSILTVDLTATEILGAYGCGFRARSPSPNATPIPMWSAEPKPDPAEWWELVPSNQNRLRIKHDSFYILRSKERLRVPPGVAVYARAIDEEIGEMRIHYAGFAHPHFGYERDDGKEGTPLIFEVRGHSVDVNLRDQEVLARLNFYRMSDDPEPDNSVYKKQELQLSNFFASWTKAPDVAPVD